MIDVTQKRRKGVSPVIAVVLMVAVAVAIAVIVFAWSSGFVSQRSTEESADAEMLVLEAQSLSGTSLTVYVRNDISLTAIVDAVYFDHQLVGNNLGWQLPADSLTTLDLSSFGAVNPGDHVMIVTERGTQIKFRVKS